MEVAESSIEKIRPKQVIQHEEERIKASKRKPNKTPGASGKKIHST